MRKFPSCLPMVAALALVMTAGAFNFNQACVFAEETCGEYGTSVIFAESTAEAAKQALKEQKLVFVLHVSGHFEESDYT